MELFIPSTTSSENSEDRTYYLNSEINSDSTQYLIEAINRINRQDSITEAILKVDGIEQKRQPIKIYINTPGGSVTDGLALIGVISSSKTPIHTIANGSVCSMGIPILLSGHKRYSLKFTSFMIHSISSMAFGFIKEIEDSARESKRLQDIVFNYIKERTHISDKKLNKIYNKKEDYFIDENKALRLNIIEEII